MNTQRRVTPDEKKKPEKLFSIAFGMEEADINVIVLCEDNRIKDLIYASTDENLIRKKMMDLRLKSIEDYRVMIFKDGKFEENSTWHNI